METIEGNYGVYRVIKDVNSNIYEIFEEQGNAFIFQTKVRAHSFRDAVFSYERLIEKDWGEVDEDDC